jgi:hypothetical protein
MPAALKVTAATDGNGYYGWVIENDTHILFKGKGLSPGNQELNEYAPKVRPIYWYLDFSCITDNITNSRSNYQTNFTSAITKALLDAVT